MMNGSQNQSSPDELEYLLKQLRQKFASVSLLTEGSPEKDSPRKSLKIPRRTSEMQFDNDVFEFSPDLQANNSNMGAGGASLNGSFELRNSSGLNNSQSRIDIKSNFYINKLMKVEDTEQLMQSLFSVAENLIQDYKKSDHRLRKERLKNRQNEHTIYEQECELVKLKQKNEEQLEIMMQFEQEYLKQKDDYNQLMNEIEELHRENKDLREIIKGFNHEKSELKQNMQEKIDFQKEQQQRVNQVLVTFKDKIKVLQQEAFLQNKKIGEYEKENQNLVKQLYESKNQNKFFRDELQHMHQIEDNLHKKQQELLASKSQQNQQATIIPEMKESIISGVSSSQQSTLHEPMSLRLEQLALKKRNQRGNNSVDYDTNNRSFNKSAKQIKKVKLERIDSIDNDDDNQLQFEQCLQVQQQQSMQARPRLSTFASNKNGNTSNKTLANELNMDVFEDFFSLGSRFEDRSQLLITDDDISELSPRYSPQNRRLSHNDLLEPFTPRNCSASNLSSAHRRRLVARVARGKDGRPLDPKSSLQYLLTKSKRRMTIALKNTELPQNVRLSQKEFASYLQKKYGRKNVKKYDDMLKNDKKIDIGALKRRATMVGSQFSRLSEIEKKVDTSVLITRKEAKDFKDVISPKSPDLKLKAQMSTKEDETLNTSHLSEKNNVSHTKRFEKLMNKTVIIRQRKQEVEQEAKKTGECNIF
ncbi:UNKNOWN [Stylonychia lemnae]|uniref:Uncharacterized protein n=1 Tax=Stylonychia lemnae TaxID=5949 RepID=A0A078AK15_STYLE|nr:UNKNOWN [Stylonychia lemnae]|eukprot:CDW81797.1 UNKNOWN [Stylonychia lemnae]